MYRTTKDLKLLSAKTGLFKETTAVSFWMHITCVVMYKAQFKTITISISQDSWQFCILVKFVILLLDYTMLLFYNYTNILIEPWICNNLKFEIHQA